MSKPKRVAVYLAATPHGGGSFQYADSILHALSTLPREQFHIRVWSPSLDDWKVSLQEKKLEYVTVNSKIVFLNKWLGRFFRLLALPVLSRLAVFRLWSLFHPLALSIAHWQPDICIFPQQSFLPLPRSVVTLAPVHDLMHRFFPQFPEVGAPMEFLKRESLFRTITNRSDGILVDSQVGKEHVLQFYPEAENHVHILPFVPPRSLLEATPSRPEALGEESHHFLFYPAQFWVHKNHTGLLKAIKMLSNKLDIHCVFSGSTSKNGYAQVMATVKDLGLESYVKVLGYVSDAEMAWLYANARCMVMPTFFGPTNIPPLEAMHFGCPMALAGNFAMPAQCKDAAIYFDPSDTEDIARAIHQVWTDEALCCSMKEAARRYSCAWQPPEFEKQFLGIFHEFFAKR